MTSKVTELAIDCADPSGLARFWCSVLDDEVQDEDDGIVTIGSPMVPEGKNRLGPVPPTLTFAHVPEGKTVKNRLHLDVNPTDRRPHTAPDLLPVAYPRSHEHDEEPRRRWRIPQLRATDTGRRTEQVRREPMARTRPFLKRGQVSATGIVRLLAGPAP
jgi:Glyoxalase-like domain